MSMELIEKGSLVILVPNSEAVPENQVSGIKDRWVGGYYTNDDDDKKEQLVSFFNNFSDSNIYKVDINKTKDYCNYVNKNSAVISVNMKHGLDNFYENANYFKNISNDYLVIGSLSLSINSSNRYLKMSRDDEGSKRFTNILLGDVSIIIITKNNDNEFIIYPSLQIGTLLNLSKQNNENEIVGDPNEAFINLLTITKKYNKLCNDEDYLFNQINSLDDNVINYLLNNDYSEENCINSDNSNRPANTLRYIILKGLSFKEEINKEYIDSIKESIIKGESNKLSKYFSSNDVLNSIVSRESDPFRKVWQKPYSVCYRFFYDKNDRDFVYTNANILANNVINELALENVSIKLWDFDGAQNSGGSGVFIAIYPDRLHDARNAYQLGMDFNDEGCFVGITKGKFIEEEDNYATKLCRSYPEMIEELEDARTTFINLNEKIGLKDDDNETIIEDIAVCIPNRNRRVDMKFNLNTILYGAPGTGKTYSMPLYAVSILENQSLEETNRKYNNRSELLNAYNEYLKEGRIVFTTFHQSYSYEDFIQGLRPDLKSSEIKFNKVDGVFKKISDAALKSNNNYVIIIDEINRGNISKIFGELITLIEADKRWGENEQLSATLPSGDIITVPNNLYIIGTMNSADKSISLVDAALRRRFNFIEMSPDSNLVNIEFRKFLDALNKYLISELGSKDLLIGHSYFIGKDVKDFADIVNQNIVPLLYEYFFDDEKKVKKAISDASAPVLYKDDKGNEFVFEVIDNPTGRLKYKVVKKNAA